MVTGLRSARVAWAMLLLMIALGVVLRSLRLTWQPLWWDEGYSVYFATESLARMFDLTARDIHPPLYYALLHGWIKLWGSAAPLVDRTLSVLLAVAALPLQAWLAWRLFPGRWRLLLIAVLLLAVNPMHIFYSQEVRMYGLGMTLSTASTALFWVWQQQPADLARRRSRLWSAVGYVVVTAMGLYSLYYFIFVPAGHLLWALIVYRRDLHRFWRVVGVQAMSAALFFPWLLYTVPRLITYVGAKVESDQDVALDPLRYLARHLATFSGGHIAWPIPVAPWALLLGGAAILVILAALTLHRPSREPQVDVRSSMQSMNVQDRAAIFLLGALVGTAVVGGWLVSQRFPFFPDGGERLLIFALPYVSLLLAVGIDRTWRIAWAGPVALLLLLIAAAGGVYTFYTTPRYVGHDYRPILRQIVQQGRNEDTLLAIFPWQVGYWRAYTSQRDPNMTGPAPQLLSDGVVGWSPAVQEMIDAARASGSIWFPEPLTFGATLPIEIEAYLAEQASNLENRWYGATRLTAWANLATPDLMDTATIDFGAVRIVEAAATTGLIEASNQPVAVELTWEIAEPVDLNVSLRLLDETGYIWSSREYAAAWSSAQPGEQESHAAGVIVPVGLPPGVYTVGVSVARMDERGESGDALTVAGSDIVDAPIGMLTVTAPGETQAVDRLPIRTLLTPPVVHEEIAFLGLTGPEPSTPLLAGTELGVTLFLQSHADMPDERSIYVSLLDAHGDGVAGYEGWPLTSFSAAMLVKDELLRVPVRFFVPAALTSGEHRLVAGFQKPGTGVKTPPVLLGTVNIEQRRASFAQQTPAISLPVPAQFGTHARLYGYALEPEENDKTTVRLYWEIIQPLLPPHHIFVHAEAPDGVIFAQQDGPPVSTTGPAPTGSWQPGEFLVTEHSIKAPAGSLIRVGLYDPVSLARLPVTLNDEAAGDSVELAPR
ncbi:MAG: hypothetical protein R6W76_22130 [Caldilinea sp.]